MKVLSKYLIFVWVIISSSNKVEAQSLIHQKCMGGFMEEHGTGIRETQDSGFILCGTKESNDGDVTCGLGYEDGWLVKTDSAFNIQWQKCFGGYNMVSELTCIDLTTDNGFIIGGNYYDAGLGVPPCPNHRENDYWVIKTDSAGNIQWQNCYGGSNWDFIYDIHQTSDGGYILGGETSSTDGDVIGARGGDPDFWLLKLDGLGNIQWSQAFGGNGYEGCNSVVETSDNCFVASGSATYSSGDVSGTHGYFDYWVIKVDSTGNLIWQKALGGSSNDAAGDLVATPGGGVLVMGEASSNDGDVSFNHGSWDTWAVQLDSSGNILWEKSYGGSGSESGRSVTKAFDGGFMLLSVGDSNDGDASCAHASDFWFVKIDSIGILQFQQCIGGSYNEKPLRVISTSDSGFAAIGETWTNNNGDVSGSHTPCLPGVVRCTDIWVVKIGSSTSGISELEDSKSLQLSYNHFENKLMVHWKSNAYEKNTIQIFDITGRILFLKTFDSFPGENNFITNFETSGSQMLMIRLLGENSVYSGKILVVNE